MGFDNLANSFLFYNLLFGTGQNFKNLFLAKKILLYSFLDRFAYRFLDVRRQLQCYCRLTSKSMSKANENAWYNIPTA